MLRAILHLTLILPLPLVACHRAAAAPPRETLDASAAGPDYARDVAPLLRKYCAGCHNDEDREGGLSLDSYSRLMEGGKRGAAVMPGNLETSRLLRTLTGAAQPAMPPEGSEGPTAAEIKTLQSWVAAGATGPRGAAPPARLVTPHIDPPHDLKLSITALDWSPAPGRLLAVGRFGRVELLENGVQPLRTLAPLPGKVNSVRFTADGRQLVTASGTAGLSGLATLWDTATGGVIREFEGHRDILYSAAVSPDGRLLATGSYDHDVILWDVETGAAVRTLRGHNGAVYDLDFSPDGSTLATASADDTVKVWSVASGQRLDTLSQPLKEQYAVRFHPNGRQIVAGGADNRIRVWQWVSKDEPRINPLLFARYAHEGAVTRLAFTPRGDGLLSSSEDRAAKLWETRSYTEARAYEGQPEVIAGLAATEGRAAFGRLDGSLELLSLPAPLATPATAASSENRGPTARQTPPRPPAESRPAPRPPAEVGPAPLPPPPPLPEIVEVEPNNSPAEAQRLAEPAVLRGVVAQPADEDLFRLHSAAGQAWVLEVNAERIKSPLDSRIEVLESDGRPVQRVLLQAVRDSYLTFRGKDSNTTDDFRVHNWQEMELNEFLYCNGEVVKLWHYPRGPDSGFLVYPGTGKRWTYFGTSPMSHPLHEPCYVVRPLAAGEPPISNGLPLFPVYYENDDDPLRRWGADSRLTFVAPHEGEFLIRVTDVRGLGGEDYRYELTVRPPQPRFEVQIGGSNPAVAAGSGREFSLTAVRHDGFDGPIEVRVESLPLGFHATSPVVIEAGEESAQGAVYAAADAVAPQGDAAKSTRLVASAWIDGRLVEQPVGTLGELKLRPNPKLKIRVSAAGDQDDAAADKPLELTIHPGETIRAEVHVERLDFKNRVSLGRHDAGRNLPHGVFVDNIGLNGLMIVEGQAKREFFITAAPTVAPGERWFHIQTGDDGGHATPPVLLRVVK